MITEKVEEKIELSEAPGIPGLSFRGFRDEHDYAIIASVINESVRADGIDDVNTPEELEVFFTSLRNFDLRRDILLAEVNGETIAYSRVRHWNGDEQGSIYSLRGFIRPAWRRKGLGRAMLRYNEQRLREIASQETKDGARWLESFSHEREKGNARLLETEGYLPVRYYSIMVRPDLEDITPAQLPEGLEVRPVRPEHLQLILDASIEAFRDHFGFSAENEPSVEDWQRDPKFDPSLWRVAWDGDQVAGMVLSFIDHNQNQEFKRLRGWTENISVRRPWRRQGLARALLLLSLEAVKERGMLEAALGVDTQNLSGAHKLYESVGFRPVDRSIQFRKPME